MSAMQQMMQGMGGGGGGLEAMMKNMDPNMVQMAEKMMMNNPSLKARAERMMKDPNAMAGAMKKLGASGQDSNGMAWKSMMQKMSAEANGGVVPDADTFKNMMNNNNDNSNNNNNNNTNGTYDMDNANSNNNDDKPYDVKKNKDILDDLADDLDMLELEEYGNRNKANKDKNYATLGKRITNLMLEFDKVDVSGSDELREERKEYIQRIQKLGDLVEET